MSVILVSEYAEICSSERFSARVKKNSQVAICGDFAGLLLYFVQLVISTCVPFFGVWKMFFILTWTKCGLDGGAAFVLSAFYIFPFFSTCYEVVPDSTESICLACECFFEERNKVLIKVLLRQ